jgi:hypothetical protein
MKPVGEPDAGNPHVRFDERGWETERCRMAQATAPILDSTKAGMSHATGFVRCWRKQTSRGTVSATVTQSGVRGAYAGLKNRPAPNGRVS